MSIPKPDRKMLEDLWRQRLNDAQLRLDFARNFLKEVEREYPAGDIPESDHRFAYQNALDAENFARAEYQRILRIYTDLMVNGIIPDEAEWLRGQSASAGGAGTESS